MQNVTSKASKMRLSAHMQAQKEINDLDVLEIHFNYFCWKRQTLIFYQSHYVIYRVQKNRPSELN